MSTAIMESESLGPKANPQIMDREHITRELECGELRGQKSIKKSSKHLLKKWSVIASYMPDL